MLDLVRSIHPGAAELAAWNAELATATPEEVLAWGAAQWHQHMALTCSFGGPAGMVLLPNGDVILAVSGAVLEMAQLPMTETLGASMLSDVPPSPMESRWA